VRQRATDTRSQRRGVKRPAWDSGWNRPMAVGELLVQPLLWPIAIVLYGLAEFRRGQLGHVRYLAKVIRTGRQGPYSGTIW
jgi:hypothetical protein